MSQGTPETDRIMAPLLARSLATGGLPPTIWNRVYEAVAALVRSGEKTCAERLVKAIDDALADAESEQD